MPTSADSFSSDSRALFRAILNASLRMAGILIRPANRARANWQKSLDPFFAVWQISGTMTLAQYLAEQNTTPAELARKLGVPASTVSRWLRGERVPRAAALVSLERITGGKVQLRDFVSDAAPEPSEAAE